MQRYLDIGGPAPVVWAMRCGIFEILPAVLRWKSTHEASVAIFLLQRLMLSEQGPETLIRPHSSLHKPPITLLCDFLSQHMSGNTINVPSDTVAGVLYLYTKALQDTNWVPSDAVQSQWKQIIDTALVARDSLVRSWAILAVAACRSVGSETRDKIRTLAQTDNAQIVRIAATFVAWHWYGPRLDAERGKPAAHVGEQRDLARFISQISEDASYNVRTIAYGLAMEWVSCHQDAMLEQIRGAKTSTDARIDDELGDTAGSQIVATLVKGSQDPLHHLQQTVENFLLHSFNDPRIGDCPRWRSFFPSLPRTQHGASAALLNPQVSSMCFAVSRTWCSGLCPQ